MQDNKKRLKANASYGIGNFCNWETIAFFRDTGMKLHARLAQGFLIMSVEEKGSKYAR